MYRYYITTPEMPAELELPTLALTESYGKNGASFKGHTFYGYREFTESLPDDTVAALGLVAGPSPVYHSIDEGSARTAHNMMSFSDYPEGQKTWEYRLNVDKASFLAASLKEKTDPLYHEKIDRLLASFSKRLAENFNVNSRIGCMCPSLMISGGSNFPVQKKRKQVAALEKNEKEYREIMGLQEKMRSVGTGGISSDDPNALEKLKERVEKLKKHQELMKAANAAIRLKNTEEGDRRLAELSFTPKEIEMLRTPDYCGRVGYPSFELSNNNANIRRLEDRIKELEKRQTEEAPEGWTFEGGEVVINTELNRVQIIFDGKPDEEMRAKLRHNAFKWAPSQGAWQRQYTRNALYAAKEVTGAA